MYACVWCYDVFFFFKQKTAYELRISDWSSDVCSSDLSVAFGLARNHPFVDGNKRTAHVCYRVFLALNDADLAASEEEKYVQMLALAEGSLSEADFAAWMRPRLQGHASGAVHESRKRYAR